MLINKHRRTVWQKIVRVVSHWRIFTCLFRDQCRFNISEQGIRHDLKHFLRILKAIAYFKNSKHFQEYIFWCIFYYKYQTLNTAQIKKALIILYFVFKVCMNWLQHV